MVVGLLFQLIGAFVLIVSWVFVFKTWDYFKERGIKFDRGLPFLGTLYRAMSGRESIAISMQDLYNRYSTDRFIGFYQMGGKPTYLVRDPELIKAVTVKDFDHFVNHGFQIDKELDPLMGRILFNINDEKWRELRSILSPLFTGSKMRMMLSLMGETVEEFIGDIKEQVLTAGPNRGVEYNLMDLFTCSTNDAIASCAFGIKINSFKDRENEFYKTGHEIAYAVQGIKAFVIMSFPKLSRWLRVKIISEKENQFFRDVVLGNVEQRKKLNIVRHDMIHLLTLMRDGKLESIAEKDDHQDAGFATISEVISSKTTEKLKSMLVLLEKYIFFALCFVIKCSITHFNFFFILPTLSIIFILDMIVWNESKQFNQFLTKGV